MKEQGTTGVEALDLQVGRLQKRARLTLALSRCVTGAFIGGGAGILYALTADFIRISFPPIAAAIIAAVVGAFVGALTGVLSPQNPVPLLIRADKALDNHDLSATAYELAARSKKSIFADAIIEDAVRSLSAADPARVLPKPRMKLLPYLPLILAASVMLSLFPMNLAEVFSARARVEPALRDLGAYIEDFGKKLEKKAIEENLQRSLDLSRELQRLGKDFQNERIDQSEAEQRLQDLESKLAEEYAAKVEEMLKQSQRGAQDGSGNPPPGKQGQTDRGSQPGQKGDEETSTTENTDPNAQAENQDLSDALNMLSQKRQGMNKQQPQGKPGTGQGQGQGQQGLGDLSEDGQGEVPMSKGDGPTPSEEGTGQQSQAGSTPQKDAAGPESSIARSNDGEQLQAQVPVTPGDTMQMLMRALPSVKGSTVTNQEQLRSYQRTAESALAQEEVPVDLREYVREYFISIGIMGSDNQGR